MATVTRKSPTGVITSNGVIVNTQDLTPSSTLAAGWQNPENVDVLAKAIVQFTTAGVGTIDVGTGTGGTGAANNIFIDGGTMAVGVISGNNALGSGGTLGGGDWKLIAANGSAGDSITVNSSDLATGTYAGRFIVHYHVL
jgi:hypothetical protein